MILAVLSLLIPSTLGAAEPSTDCANSSINFAPLLSSACVSSAKFLGSELVLMQPKFAGCRVASSDLLAVLAKTDVASAVQLSCRATSQAVVATVSRC